MTEEQIRYIESLYSLKAHPMVHELGAEVRRLKTALRCYGAAYSKLVDGLGCETHGVMDCASCRPKIKEPWDPNASGQNEEIEP